ncbi:MAG TPA: hypothetical protein VNW50_04670 [Streptosporangiaceae bacterium]|nr:hypothetical protein [Streptosporangiaceae bacterium]
MRRRTFDALAAAAGLILAAILAVAGVLLTWGHSYANNQVSSQLSAQKIVFPTTSSPEFKILPAANRAQMAKYAGQLMTNGAQAETYANYFIGRHLLLIGGGKTYSQLSTQSLAQPKNTALAGQVQTVFRGTTLRSMLLEAYGFWQLGQIALIAAIASFIAAGLMLVLSVFGFVHLRHAAPEAEILPKVATRVQANAT